jgi:hypothetical protein
MILTMMIMIIIFLILNRIDDFGASFGIRHPPELVSQHLSTRRDLRELLHGAQRQPHFYSP